MSQLLVLLVEDEALVRWVAHEALEDAGYQVIEAENADQALAVLSERRDVGLLFTDINMPGAMDGLALAELVNARWPDIQLVVTSGRGLERPVPDSGRFLRKPYSIGELTDAMRPEDDRT